VTYAASQVAYWVGQANDNSGSTHPPGYVAGQRWSSTAGQWQADRNAWNANAIDTSGGPHPPGWASGQLWSTTASQWQSSYNTSQSNLTTMTNNYNTLLNGLNNPDGLQSQGFAVNHNGGGTEIGIGTFTFSRAGHFLVAVILPISSSNVTQNNATSTLRLSGVITLTQMAAIGAQGGARNWWHGTASEVDVSAGQTLGLFYNAFTATPATGTATVYAHFVPNATYHN
jgi:hypothetical protein